MDRLQGKHTLAEFRKENETRGMSEKNPLLETPGQGGFMAAKALIFGIIAMTLGCSVHRPDMDTTMLVTVRQRSNAEGECSDLLERSTRACAIRHTPQGCMIIISHDDAGNSEILGHEFRHCLSGDYH